MLVVFKVLLIALAAGSLTVLADPDKINLDNLNYHIKWLTRSTRLPLRIDKRIDDPATVPFDADFKWYKYPEKQFINEIDNYQNSYSYQQTDHKIELNIHKYDRHTHEQLSSYIALPVAFRSTGSGSENLDHSVDFRNDIFTVAYLDRQEIEFEADRNSEMVNFYCNVSVLIPYTDLSINKINVELVQQNLDLKMGLLDRENTKLNLIKTDKIKSKGDENKPHRNREKRAAGKNLIVFLQINENIGPLSIFKEQIEGMGKNRLFCDVELSDGSNSNDKRQLVYGNRIQKELNEFDIDQGIYVFEPWEVLVANVMVLACLFLFFYATFMLFSPIQLFRNQNRIVITQDFQS